MSSLVAYGRQGELPLLTPLTWEGSQLAGCGGLARADSCYIVSDRLNAPQGTFHDCRILHAMVHIIIMQLSFRTDMEICHKSTVKVKACYISSSYYFRFCIIVTATNPKKMLVMVCKRNSFIYVKFYILCSDSSVSVGMFRDKKHSVGVRQRKDNILA